MAVYFNVNLSPKNTYLQRRFKVVDTNPLITPLHFRNVEASQVTIRVGGSNSIYSRTFFAQSITLHPLFSINAVENIIENDIAIVQVPVLYELL